MSHNPHIAGLEVSDRKCHNDIVAQHLQRRGYAPCEWPKGIGFSKYLFGASGFSIQPDRRATKKPGQRRR
ncbi:hypothetical protein V1291_003591 [Nitrobacteraceae bacterium AZCC 1564]